MASRRRPARPRRRPPARPRPGAAIDLPAPGLRIIGIDCATLPQNTGIAVATPDPERPTRLRVHAARCCVRGEDLAAVVTEAIGPGPALLALDAPLGWPAPLADTLSWHQAGAPLGSPLVTDDRMFSRATDLDIRERFGKRPLEVGADRIARTARAALRLLAELERLRNQPVPLSWSPGSAPEGPGGDGSGTTAAIEVYPAATLAARGIPAAGYRQVPARRRAVLRALAPDLRLPPALDRVLAASPHALDAVLCLIAAADFLAGNVRPPPVDATALSHREGWIWVREREPARLVVTD